ncbi:hypothetical protein CCAX7_14470 [Capsulimonas corticalis]|uniref:Uncharacterized protein n=1 Tax=Capsulimonas corticalis TaxID=2219043 RepID=A0A402CZG5_9BACT|nr:hypothetical protein [Capsulimonas corticalis]BDI29396.1 hypothetical protein CCAX7_14470 [Capsulimonas corticalis]
MANDDGIIGSTARIDSQDALDLLTARAEEINGGSAQSPSADVDSIVDDLAAKDATDLGETPAAAPSRKRRQNPEVAERQRLQTQKVRDNTDQNLIKRQAETAAAQAKADAIARTAEAKADATIRTAEARARSAEARAAKVAPTPLDPSVVDAAVDFASDFQGYRDEASDAWMQTQLDRGIPVTRQSMNALRPEMVQNFAERPAPPREPTPAERQLNEFASFRESYTGKADQMEEAFRDHLIERGEATPAQRLAAEKDSFRQSLPGGKSREAMKTSQELGFAVGYGFQSVTTGVTKALDPMMSGEAYLPGQSWEQAGSSLFPLAGSLVGTMIGGRVGGPGGSLAGQFIGQGIGQTAEDLLDTYRTGHTYAQQRAGEMLGSGRGGADAVEEFTNALRNAATPAAKELAETLTKLGQNGPVTAGSVNEFGQLQSSMGVAFDHNVTTLGGFLDSSPFFGGLRAKYGSGPTTGVSQQDYLGVANAAALSGNYDAMDTALAHAEAVRDMTYANPQYVKDKEFTDRYTRETSNPFSSEYWSHVGKPSQDDAYEAALDRLKHEPKTLPGAPTLGQQETAIRAAFEAHNLAQSDVLSGQAASATVGARLQLDMIYGGNGSTIRAALPGIEAGVSSQIRGLQRDADMARKAAAALTKNDPETLNIKRQLLASADVDDSKILGLRSVAPSTKKAGYYPDEDAVGAGYGLSRSEDQYSLTVGLLAGGSYQGLAVLENKSLDTQVARAAHLRKLAQTDPYADSAKKAGYLTEAIQIETSAQSERYDYARSIDRQEIDSTNLDVGHAQAGVERALAYAGPSSYSSAFGAEAAAYGAKIQALTEQLQRGGLTVDDYNRKEQELTSTRRAANALPGQEATAFYGASLAIAGAGIDKASTTAQIARLTGGSDVVNPLLPDVISQMESERSLLLDKSRDPRIAEPARREAEEAAERMRMQQIGVRFQEVQFSQEPVDQGHQIDVEGALSRVGRSFLEPGNVSALRSEALRMAREDISGYDAQVAKAQGTMSKSEFDVLRPAIALQRNQLLGKVTDLAESADADFYKNLPALSIGGGSFERRDLPSPARVAADMEGRGYAGIAVRNFGFFKRKSGLDFVGETGDISAGGRDYAVTHPGDTTAQGLAQAIAALQKSLENLTIKGDITVKDGSNRSKMTGTIKSGTTDQQGLGAAVPGLPHN